jgi:hypothetical protein
MKVVGFTFVRNAITYDYPVEASIRSLLPLCDELVVAVGNSKDATRELVASIDSPKIKIIDTVWDDSLRVSGRVLAVETDKAYAAIPDDADWAIYLQADELLHEKDYDTLRGAMERYKDKPEVEGLLFAYQHFYGNYDYIGDARKWYLHEVRILRKRPDIHSYRDAQGFRKDPDGMQKLNVVPVDAHIYHYGWVKPPDKQADKRAYFESLYAAPDPKLAAIEEWDYSDSTRLKPFTGSHPKEMQERIARLNWQFHYDPKKARYTLKERILGAYEKHFGRRLFEFRNYKVLKTPD